MALVELHTETATVDLYTAPVMVLTHQCTASAYCQAMLEIGTAAKPLTGAANAAYSVTVGMTAGTLQPNPQVIRFAVGKKAVIHTAPFVVPENATVSVLLKSPASGDTSVAVTSHLYDVSGTIADSVLVTPTQRIVTNSQGAVTVIGGSRCYDAEHIESVDSSRLWVTIYSGASDLDDYYNGMMFTCYWSSSGYGASRRIIDYDGATRKVYLDHAFPPGTDIWKVNDKYVIQDVPASIAQTADNVAAISDVKSELVVLSDAISDLYSDTTIISSDTTAIGSGAGAGALEVTVDCGGAEAGGCNWWITATNNSQAAKVASGTATDLGIATAFLDAGQFFLFRSKTGTNFTTQPRTLDVS